MAEQITVKINDTFSLKGQRWQCESAKAEIIILEGMEEHLSRYNAFADYLNKMKFSVSGFDYFGQGLNANEDLSNRGIWPLNGFDLVVDGVHELVQSLKTKNLPVYIFAHSMGSFVAQRYIEKYPCEVNKVVLCGAGAKNPALGIGYLLSKITTPKKKRNDKSHFIANLMFGSFNKKILNPRTPFDWLSYDNNNVNNYINDPLCGFGSNKGFCYEFIKGMLPIYKKRELKKIGKFTKIFIISGKDDPVTNYSKSVETLKVMFNKLGITSVFTKVYQNRRHEILNEGNTIDIFEDVNCFLNK